MWPLCHEVGCSRTGVQAVDQYLFFLSNTPYFPPNIDLALQIGRERRADSFEGESSVVRTCHARYNEIKREYKMRAQNLEPLADEDADASSAST